MSAERIPGLALAAALALAASGAARADDSGDLQFHGFASQGYVYSSGNNLNGSSADGNGSFDYQEFGLNGSWRPRGDLLLSAQVASVHAGNATDETLALEYALADWTFLQRERGRLGLRGGKLKLPIGFYNDSRDVVFARPGILLPQGVYLDTAGGRAFGYFASWGLTAYGDLYAGDHAIYVEAGGFGEQDLGDTADVAILRSDATGEFEVESGGILRIADDWDGGRARAAVSLLSVKLNYDPNPASPGAFDQEGVLDFSQALLSLQYNWAQFSLTAEYVWRDFQLTDLVSHPVLSSAVDLSPSGAYLQGTWRFRPTLSAFLRYDEQIRDGGDRRGERQQAESRAISAMTGGAVPAQDRHYYFARDWATGLRWDVRSNLALWGEFHYVDGVAWLSPLDNPRFRSGGAERYWNFVAVMLGYRF